MRVLLDENLDWRLKVLGRRCAFNQAKPGPKHVTQGPDIRIDHVSLRQEVRSQELRQHTGVGGIGLDLRVDEGFDAFGVR